MNEILSLAAFVPLSLLPAIVIDELRQALRHELTDSNTTCYVLRIRQGNDNSYTVTADVTYNPEEPPETETIYLDGLTDQEQQHITALIGIRMIAALDHIED